MSTSDCRCMCINTGYSGSPLNEVLIRLSETSGLRYHLQSPPLPDGIFNESTKGELVKYGLMKWVTSLSLLIKSPSKHLNEIASHLNDAIIHCPRPDVHAKLTAVKAHYNTHQSGIIVKREAADILWGTLYADEHTSIVCLEHDYSGKAVQTNYGTGIVRRRHHDLCWKTRANACITEVELPWGRLYTHQKLSPLSEKKSVQAFKDCEIFPLDNFLTDFKPKEGSLTTSMKNKNKPELKQTLESLLKSSFMGEYGRHGGHLDAIQSTCDDLVSEEQLPGRFSNVPRVLEATERNMKELEILQAKRKAESSDWRPSKSEDALAAVVRSDLYDFIKSGAYSARKDDISECVDQRIRDNLLSPEKPVKKKKKLS